MKYFQNLLLLGINFSAIVLSQSIEIDHKMMNMQDETVNIPIFIKGVSNLESIDLTIEYDKNIISVEDIIENPLGILNDWYSFNTNLNAPGIYLGIGSNSANMFSGGGMVAQIIFNKSISNTLGFSALTISDAVINSESVLGTAIDGSIEIILDELTITGQDNSGIGAEHSITLGMCEGCGDEWKFGQDEYDYPDPQDEYTNIHFYHPEWMGTQDINDNTCIQDKFSTDFRSQHSFRELTSWAIRGSTGGGLSFDIPIKLSWDSNKLNSTSDSIQMFIYVGETGYDMQEMDNIIVSQSELYLGYNNPANIWVKMGGCAETGETITYYQDSDGDGLGDVDDLGVPVEKEFCEGLQLEGWVETNDGDTCDGDEDCLGVCGGYAVTDACGVCDLDENNNNQCYDCNFEPNGGAILDNCGICILEGENSTCEMDCAGEWGGDAILDECGVCKNYNTQPVFPYGTCDCAGTPNGEGWLNACEECVPLGDTSCLDDCNGEFGGLAHLDNCGTCILEGEISSCEMDCAGEWGGSAEIDVNCEICIGGTTGLEECSLDCNGIWGGNSTIDECDVCDTNPDNDNEQCLDCYGNVNGDFALDYCGVCDDDPSNDCKKDCSDEWGGSAIIDNCNICVGGNTDKIACVKDCNGDWGGYAFEDDCGICDSDYNNNNQCYDCNFEPNGGAILNNCGICILEGVNSTCEMDCAGEWGGGAILDECGVCKNYDTQPVFPYGTCDCAGTPNGERWLNACEECVPLGDTSCPIDCNGVNDGLAYLDNCGTCILEGEISSCEMDCAGEWGGSAEIDVNCEICIGGTTGLEECSLDCNGIWGGNYKIDLCDICDADSVNDNQCVDCNGMVNGLAELDNCGNCVEDLSDSSYECEPDCDGIYGGNNTPTFSCENGEIACNYYACFDLSNKEFQLPKKFDISRIYPNPFNPQATIDFEVSEPTMVQLNIYNLNGQKVDVLKNAFTLPGHYSVIWNGTNHPSSMYFVILQSSNSIVKQKMMLIK